MGSGNKKDIILKVSPLGIREYEEYARHAASHEFRQLFDVLDQAGPEELATVKKVFSIIGGWHSEKRETPEEPVRLIRVESRK